MSRPKHTNQPVFETVLRQRYMDRRAFLKGLSLSGASVALGGCATFATGKKENPFGFDEVSQDISETLVLPANYRSDVLIRWGDPLFANLPEFDPHNQTAALQEKRFGYNNDYTAFLPFEENNSEHALLVVNHENTDCDLMFPGSPKEHELPEHYVPIDIVANGMTVVEIYKEEGRWRASSDSQYNRRVTPHTPMHFSGPAAGSERLKTAISTDGILTLGTYGNCAGGVTPWGTVLPAEENIDSYFTGDPLLTEERENYSRFGFFRKRYKNWGVYNSRWNLQTSPREPLHMGWIVEIDPFDPSSTPRKHTALGRFKHEAANLVLDNNNHAVIYSGDDQEYEYIYKFVSKNTYRENDRQHNMTLLEEGILYAARFDPDGSLTWLPLVFGQGPLTSENGFSSQGDISLDTRKAADLMGATPMDRPEDIEINPANKKVYAMLTNNAKRTADRVDAANPRAHNSHGQIIEFWPQDGNHSSVQFRWELFLLAGNPKNTVTLYHPDTGERGWLSCPDNCVFDSRGNLWVGTDGAEKAAGIAEGLWVTEVDGANRALTRRFLSLPRGSELCGPYFSPSERDLFLSVQHPAEGSSFDKPATRWPDFDSALPPRPSVVVIQRKDGGVIGVKAST